MTQKNTDLKPQGYQDSFRLGRKESQETVHSGMYPDFWSQLHESPSDAHNTEEQTFYEKILPGLSCFAMLEEGQDDQQSMRNELDDIDPLLFADAHQNDTSPQQFFNYIENESDYERMKNRKFGMFVSDKDKTFENEFKACFEQSYNGLVSSKLFEFVNNTEIVNRIENFLTVEIESNDRSESPLERIKHDYFEFLYRLKNKMASKDKNTKVLNPLVEFAFSVLRTLLKSIKSFDDKRTTECMMKMALMDKNLASNFDKSSNPSKSF